jgi:hypothetical protein
MVVTSMKSVCAYLSVTTLYWYWPPSMGPRSMIQYWPTQHTAQHSQQTGRGGEGFNQGQGRMLLLSDVHMLLSCGISEYPPMHTSLTGIEIVFVPGKGTSSKVTVSCAG